jgi:hypothetical protein
MFAMTGHLSRRRIQIGVAAASIDGTMRDCRRIRRSRALLAGMQHASSSKILLHMQLRGGYATVPRGVQRRSCCSLKSCVCLADYKRYGITREHVSWELSSQLIEQTPRTTVLVERHIVNLPHV